MKKYKPDWAFQVKVIYKTPKLQRREQNQIFDEFVDFIESIDIGLGGSYDPVGFSYILTSTKDRKTITDDDRAKVTAWFQERDDIARFSVGRLKDGNDEDAF